ncbi:ABC transporter ATP-binding protein [Halorientalis salina]|uniref:ABC transporter ATP-binding protein n=1 Tax=Halorientalis salina TaxID=2932266 RepID=UPI0010AC4F1C|nr:ABC transporter ATP-binding protein [Halorientalis salina]
MVLLELSDVHAGYGGGNVINGVSLTIEEGTVVSLLGRNGVGKTTTLRSIVGVISPDRGTVSFDSLDISGFEPHETYKQGISLVPEDRGIFPDLTVSENLRVPLVDTDDERSIAEIYGYFPKLEELQDSKGRNLSGGEQQMLAIGRALRQNPRLLLLDEPSEGLAPQIIEDVGRAIETIAEEGMTILVVEQNTKFALDISSHAYIMADGQIVMDGSTNELRDDEERLEKYLGVHET